MSRHHSIKPPEGGIQLGKPSKVHIHSRRKRQIQSHLIKTSEEESARETNNEKRYKHKKQVIKDENEHERATSTVYESEPNKQQLPSVKHNQQKLSSKRSKKSSEIDPLNSTTESVHHSNKKLLTIDADPSLLTGANKPYAQSVGGRMLMSSVLQPDIGFANNSATFSSYGDRATSYALVIGIPLFGCIALFLLICLMFRYCRRLGQSSKDKTQLHIGSQGNTFNGHSPISFMSGGKVMEGFKVIKMNMDQQDKFNSDSRQLTINMEENSTSNDSDEQVEKQTASTRSTNKKKRDQHEKIDLNENLGRIKYKINYDFNESLFSVTILQAENLPALDLCGSSDPYVKVYLLPDKQQCEKTRIHKKSLNPIFDETFHFKVSYSDLNNRTLVLAVYDYDRFSKHDEIGHVSIPVGSIDLAQTKEEWSDLKRMRDEQVSFGCYLSLS